MDGLVVALAAAWLIAPGAQAQAPDAVRHRRGVEALPAKGQLPGVPRLAGLTAAADNQMPDGLNLRESKPRTPPDDDHAGGPIARCWRSRARLHRRPLRQDLGRPEDVSDADARSAGGAAAARSRADHRLPHGEGHRKGPWIARRVDHRGADVDAAEFPKNETAWRRKSRRSHFIRIS